jgi:archaellum biogenesis ATPase FlaH
MGIPITIAGLNEYIKEIPSGNTIVLQGNIEPIKTLFIQFLAHQASLKGYNVSYISSRAKEEVAEQLKLYNGEINFPIIEERSSRHWKDHITKDCVLIIDSFSYLILDDSLIQVRDILEELDSICKKFNAIILLTIEEGMLDEKVQVTLSHIADGIIQFFCHDTSKGIVRFMRIPKWINRKSFDDKIFYHFDGRKINVDLRARVT